MKLSCLAGRFQKILLFRISAVIFFASIFVFPVGWLQTLFNDSYSVVYGSPANAGAGHVNRAFFQALSTYTPYPTYTAYPTYTPHVSATPVPARSLIINEVAWMGDRVSSDNEWIEIYNPTEYPIALSGWKLGVRGDPTFVIAFDNQILPRKSFYILKRSSMLSINIGGALVQTYISRLLSDGGEYLQLLDPAGNVVDTANMQNLAWPAGNKTSFCSMERAGYNTADAPINWITNSGQVTNGTDANNSPLCGTPNMENWAYSVTPTATFTRTPTPSRTITSTPTASKTATITHTPTLTPGPYSTPSIVVLNEFLVQPRQDWNGDGKVDTGDEFIEIINLGNEKISLLNWVLDDQPGDSDAYKLGAADVIEGKSRLAFFRSQTGILLSSGGDSVRLFKSNGQISDAFSYTINRIPGLSWCRLPDGGHKWIFGCEPTLEQINRKAEAYIMGNRIPAICVSSKLPGEVLAAECDAAGLSVGASAFEEGQSDYPIFIDVGADLCMLD